MKDIGKQKIVHVKVTWTMIKIHVVVEIFFLRAKISGIKRQVLSNRYI